MTTAVSPLPAYSRRRPADGLPERPVPTRAALLPSTIASGLHPDTAPRGSVEEVAETAAGAPARGSPRPRQHRTPLRHVPLEIVDRLIAGEAEAYEDLVAQHGPMMLAVATRYLRRSHDAEDAVQDALLNVLRFISRFQRESSLETWLHRIVVNCALMHLRRQRRKPAATLDARLLENGAASPWRRSPSPSAQEIVATEETRAIVRASIGRLPEAQRSTTLLRDVEGLTTGKTAEALGIQPSRVRVTLHRAHRRLKRALASVEIQNACI